MNENGLLLRFVRELPLMRRLFPLSFVLILCAATLPQIFLWYVGRYVECGMLQVCMAEAAGIPLSVALGGLALLAAAAMLARVASWMVFELTGMHATKELHARMVQGLARVRTTYFDEHVSGQILNRMVGDFGMLLGAGIYRLSDFLNTVGEVIAIGVLVLIANPWPAAILVPFAFAVIRFQERVGVMRGRLREVASAARGTLVHRITDLVEGGRVFRAFGKEGALFRRLGHAYADQLNSDLLLGQLQAWGRFWVKVAAGLYGFAAIGFLGYQTQRGSVTIALAAVILSALFSLEGTLSFLSLAVMNLGETLGSARRVFEFVDLPPEAATERSDGAVAAPSVHIPVELSAGRPGTLRFEAFRMSYRPGLPETLHGIDLEIPAGARVGIVGRTGSGKTSLCQALFRMVYVTGGAIFVNGHSIHSFAIDAWRRLFAVVPQQPYLFKGTVGSNIDRNGVLTATQIEAALRIVGLSIGANGQMSEGGSNLSLGERQLVCLARALAHRCPYVIMDEPTSAIDNATDARIQAILRQDLREATVITIAHRLETLQGYDLIVELADGRIGSMRKG